MGLFGGDDKKKKPQRGRGDDEARSSTTKRKSRRIVTPGQKGSSDSARVERRARSSAVRPAADAGARPQPAQPKAPPPAQPKAPPPPKQQPVAKPPPPPPPPPKPAAPPAGAPDLFADDEPQVVVPAVKRDAGKQPISLDESGDLEFGGDLSAAKGSGQRGQASHSGDRPLVEFLVDKAKLIDAEQGQMMLAEASGKDIPVDQACIQAKLLSEDQLVNALTQECWVPHLKVDKYEIRKKALDTISEADARYFSVLPVDKLGSILNLAMVNPLDVDAIDELQSKTALDIKKVVATRSEIEQGILRYYGGGAEAKEGSLEIAQDKGSQRVTTMLSRKPADEAPVAPPEPAPVAALPDEAVDEDQIADIDDLLGGNEEVAPAIIEPITLDASEFEEEPFDDDDDEELFEPELIEDPEIIEEIEVANEAPALQRQASSDAADDMEPAILPGTTRHEAPQAPPVVAAEATKLADEDDSLALPEVEEAPAAETLVQESAPVANKPPPPPAPVQPAAAAVPPPAPAAPPSPPKPAAKPATARKAAPSRRRSRDLVDLVPVMEEDFQHAISHGKARIFEKWVSLQTRNRILNAVGVEQELDGVLAGLYGEGERISA